MILAICPRSHQDYLSLPIFGPILDEFTNWSHQRGYALSTIRSQLKHIHHITAFFQKKDLQSSSELKQCDFQNAWQHFRHDCPAIAGTIRQLQRFLDETHGLPPPLPIPKTRSDKELERFSGYLKDVRGLVDTTIQSHITYLGRFLDSIGFETNEKALLDLSLKQVEDFLGTCSKALIFPRKNGHIVKTLFVIPYSAQIDKDSYIPTQSVSSLCYKIPLYTQTTLFWPPAVSGNSFHIPPQSL